VIFAFALYKYFPYGGLQRDFLKIALEMVSRGHQVRVYCNSWQGDIPVQFDVLLVPVKGQTSQAKNRFFTEFMQEDLAQRPVDCVMGFNKMPGLDVYFAADSCYAAKALQKRGRWYALTPRYRHFKGYEEAIFSQRSKTQILLLSQHQQTDFSACYGTDSSRLHMLPPGIDRSRKAPPNAEELRRDFRQEFAIGDDEFLLLQVGSGFITKGVDRSLIAMAALPAEQLAKTYLYIVGQDKVKKFKRQAEQLGLANRVRFFEGRDDIPRFLLGADLLIHPARAEAAGMILVEAVIAGLPVLTTDICGYACHVSKANAGVVMASPFEQTVLNRQLAQLITSPEKADWRKNGLNYAEAEALYSQTEVVAGFLEALPEKGGSQ